MWQQLAGLGCVNEILSQISAPTLHSHNYGLLQSDADIPPDDLSNTSESTDVEWDTHSYLRKNTKEEGQITANSDAMPIEANTPAAATTSAGTSLHGQTRTMS
jgi:hypothetical protein